MSRMLSLVALALCAAAAAASIATASSAGTPAKVDPLAVGYLIGQGYTPAQVKAWTVGACSHQVKPAACFGPSRGAGLVDRGARVDPLAVGYLTGRGLSPSEVKDWTTGACSHESKPASCFAALDQRVVSAAPTAISQPGGFSWGDAGIGAGAALGLALLLAGTGMALVLSRHNRRRGIAGA